MTTVSGPAREQFEGFWVSGMTRCGRDVRAPSKQPRPHGRVRCCKTGAVTTVSDFVSRV